MFEVIDVSKYQANIDFTKVKASGIKGVIIRAGYRGYGKAGTIQTDPYFFENVEKCTKAGLPYGVYFFSQAISIAEAEEEAKYTLDLINKTGVNPQFPIYIDSEYSNVLHNGRADGLSVSKRTEIVKAFCEYVEGYDYYAAIYASTNWLNTKLNMSKLSSYDVWVAHYSSKCTYKGAYGMWQYSSNGKVNGINGRVDVNKCYRDYPSIITNAGLNGSSTKVKLYDFEAFAMSKGDKERFIKLADELGIEWFVKER